MPKDAKTIQEELCAPFAAADLEWRIQMAFPDDMRGIAVPYVTNRAIQNRLDSVVGVDHWYNDYKPWHGAGKKESQICGISIFFEDRGWITKWDGAEDSDIEPIKGGLSDSMKRSAVQWGIGRILYGMDTVYVDIEKKGKNFIIKKSETGEPFFENCYPRVVKDEGSPAALKLMDEFLEPVDTEWRGLGIIEKSGVKLRDKYSDFDARVKFSLPEIKGRSNPACRCGEVLQGKCKPTDCKVFGKGCTPLHPIGACMVSDEGACAAYYQYGGV